MYPTTEWAAGIAMPSYKVVSRRVAKEARLLSEGTGQLFRQHCKQRCHLKLLLSVKCELAANINSNGFYFLYPVNRSSAMTIMVNYNCFSVIDPKQCFGS